MKSLGLAVGLTAALGAGCDDNFQFFGAGDGITEIETPEAATVVSDDGRKRTIRILDNEEPVDVGVVDMGPVDAAPIDMAPTYVDMEPVPDMIVDEGCGDVFELLTGTVDQALAREGGCREFSLVIGALECHLREGLFSLIDGQTERLILFERGGEGDGELAFDSDMERYLLTFGDRRVAFGLNTSGSPFVEGAVKNDTGVFEVGDTADVDLSDLLNAQRGEQSGEDACGMGMSDVALRRMRAMADAHPIDRQDPVQE